MTLQEMTDDIMGRLNLTSATAQARIKRNIQERYRQVLGSVGLQTAARGDVTANTVPDSRYVTFTGVQKVYAVFGSNGRPLDADTTGTLRNQTPIPTGSPRCWASYGQTHETVTIILDKFGPAAPETLTADALVDLAVLGDNDEPSFSALYHDVLVYWAKAIELRKLEKTSLAEADEDRSDLRLGELRLFLAKNRMLEIAQGKRARGTRVVGTV